jgi:basic amino acid/polyamine antiporter, APA family
LGRLSRKNAIPVISTLVQGGIAALLAISGTFDELTDSVVFASWIFYGLTAGAIFKVRGFGKSQSQSGGFRTPLYPALPIIFLFCSAGFITYAAIAMPYLTGLGLGVILLGVPGYFWFTRQPTD